MAGPCLRQPAVYRRPGHWWLRVILATAAMDSGSWADDRSEPGLGAQLCEQLFRWGAPSGSSAGRFNGRSQQSFATGQIQISRTENTPTT